MIWDLCTGGLECNSTCTGLKCGGYEQYTKKGPGSVARVGGMQFATRLVAYRTNVETGLRSAERFTAQAWLS